MNLSPSGEHRLGAPRKLAVLGATGGVGRDVVTQTLAVGHEVTARARAAEARGDRLRVALVGGDATSAADRPGLVYRAALGLMRRAIPAIVRDHREQACLIEASGLAWALVRGPVVFTDGPRTGRYHAGPIGHESSLRISPADLAAFMLETATDGGFVRMKPLVSG